MRRAAALFAFCFSFACGTTPNLGASPPAGASLASNTEGAARALARYYRVENDGVTDAYIERAAAYGLPEARSEACRLPSGVLSVRPTVLANPPLGPAAIEQRRALFADLGAYASALDALATGREESAVAALGTLRRRTLDLVRAANEHALANDLFIEDAATTLARGVARLASARDSAASLRALGSTGPTVAALSAILADDFTRQRKNTIAATALAYRWWQASVGAARGAARSETAASPPFCSEPAVFDGGDGREPAAAATSGASPPSARGARLFRRMDAVRRVDLSPVLQALATFDADQLRSLHEPANASAVADARAARKRLTTELHDFIRAMAAAA